MKADQKFHSNVLGVTVELNRWPFWDEIFTYTPKQAPYFGGIYSKRRVAKWKSDDEFQKVLDELNSTIPIVPIGDPG